MVAYPDRVKISCFCIYAKFKKRIWLELLRGGLVADLYHMCGFPVRKRGKKLKPVQRRIALERATRRCNPSILGAAIRSTGLQSPLLGTRKRHAIMRVQALLLFR